MQTVPDQDPASEHELIEADTPVTTVIRQHPAPNAVGRYETWLNEIVPVAQTFAGHQGVSVIRPHGAEGAYTIVLHFDTVSHLREWLDAPIRMRLVAEIRPFLRMSEQVDIKTGLQFWFTPPNGRTARSWKQFLLTLSAIFPLTIAVPWLLGPLFRAVPMLALPGVSHLLVASLIVGAMVYAVMPRYTRLVSQWLFR